MEVTKTYGASIPRKTAATVPVEVEEQTRQCHNDQTRSRKPGGRVSGSLFVWSNNCESRIRAVTSNDDYRDRKYPHRDSRRK